MLPRWLKQANKEKNPWVVTNENEVKKGKKEKEGDDERGSDDSNRSVDTVICSSDESRKERVELPWPLERTVMPIWTKINDDFVPYVPECFKFWLYIFIYVQYFLINFFVTCTAYILHVCGLVLIVKKFNVEPKASYIQNNEATEPNCR